MSVPTRSDGRVYSLEGHLAMISSPPQVGTRHNHTVTRSSRALKVKSLHLQSLLLSF